MHTSGLKPCTQPLTIHCQVSEFLFGDGFAITGGDDWRVRRRAVGPSLHKAYLEAMVARVFGPSAQHLAAKLQARAFPSVRVPRILPGWKRAPLSLTCHPERLSASATSRIMAPSINSDSCNGTPQLR